MRRKRGKEEGGDKGREKRRLDKIEKGEKEKGLTQFCTSSEKCDFSILLYSLTIVIREKRHSHQELTPVKTESPL